MAEKTLIINLPTAMLNSRYEVFVQCIIAKHLQFSPICKMTLFLNSHVLSNPFETSHTCLFLI